MSATLELADGGFVLLLGNHRPWEAVEKPSDCRHPMDSTVKPEDLDRCGFIPWTSARKALEDPSLAAAYPRQDTKICSIYGELNIMFGTLVLSHV